MRKFALILALALIVALSSSAFAGGTSPQVSMTQNSDGSWTISINFSGPLTVNINGQTVNQPAPAPTISSGRLFGSCTAMTTGQQFDLSWIDSLRRLQLSDSTNAALNQVHLSSVVVCHLNASASGATVEAAGRTDIPVAPNQDWFWTFQPGNFQVGFAANQN